MRRNVIFDGYKVDKAAHYLMNTLNLQGIPSRYSVDYHEDGLYSIYDKELKTVTLVYADSKKAALAMVGW